MGFIMNKLKIEQVQISMVEIEKKSDASTVQKSSYYQQVQVITDNLDYK